MDYIVLNALFDERSISVLPFYVKWYSKVPPKWIVSEIYSIKILLIEEERGSDSPLGKRSIG